MSVAATIVVCFVCAKADLNTDVQVFSGAGTAAADQLTD